LPTNSYISRQGFLKNGFAKGENNRSVHYLFFRVNYSNNIYKCITEFSKMFQNKDMKINTASLTAIYFMEK